MAEWCISQHSLKVKSRSTSFLVELITSSEHTSNDVSHIFLSSLIWSFWNNARKDHNINKCHN